MVKFKTEDQKFLGRLLIFTPIPLDAQDVWSLNQFSKERMKSVQHSHKNISFIMRTLMKRLNEKSHEKASMKFCMFLSLYTTDYLIGLAF